MNAGRGGDPRCPTMAELLALRGLAGKAAATSEQRRAGQTFYRGRGQDVLELRSWQPGDETRHIDWRRSARHGFPCVKVFGEERSRAVHLLLDDGPHMHFGTRQRFKSKAAACLAALIAWRTIFSGSQLYALLGTGKGGRVIRASSDERSLGTLFAALTSPSSCRTANLTEGLALVAHRIKEHDTFFVISDFLSLEANAIVSLERLVRQAESWLIGVYDPFESMPPRGRFRFSDGERTMVVDFRDEQIRRRQQEAFILRRQPVVLLARRLGAHWLPWATDDDFAHFPWHP